MKLPHFIPDTFCILHSAFCIALVAALSAKGDSAATSAGTPIHIRAADAPEPIHWSGGGWDMTGAPKGKLLTDNEGWWGRAVFTGVTYDYETEPDNPRDTFKGDAAVFGRRLLDGNAQTGWHRPVGMTKKHPVVAVFDFKRPCVFNEVDLMAEKSPQAAASLSVSDDGTNWTSFAEAVCTKGLTRIRPETPGKGRYLRVSYLSRTSTSTYLDEVLVWGDGEVSEAYPENVRPIPRGDALRMAGATNGVVEWIPLQDPTAKSKEQFGQPSATFAPDPAAGGEILMARNETETRYFAVANGTTGAVAVALSASGFGEGVTAELRIGGLVRTQKPKYKLTEKQRFDLLLTGDEPEEAFDANKVGIIPFFDAANVPPENFARKFLANPEQVIGFPSRVEIAPGECAVVMLRLTTDGAAPGERGGVLAAAPRHAGGPGAVPAAAGEPPAPRQEEGADAGGPGAVPAAAGEPPAPRQEEGADAGGPGAVPAAAGDNRQTVKPSNCQTDDAPATRSVVVRVVDATLPDDGSPWIYIWGPFTPQFPYESATRYANDARAVRDLGPTELSGFPAPDTKVELVSRGRRDRMLFRAGGISPRLDGLIYNGKLATLDDAARAEISNQLAKVRARAEACGVRPEQVDLTLVDEPGAGNAKICGEVCRFIREVAPDMTIYLNPSFWQRTHFASAEKIIAAMGDYYADCVDVSVPYRSLTESEAGRKALWATKRRVNASYAHPAHRAGRSIAWSNFRYGLDGFAYWCYYWNTGGNTWDIRTWRIYAYEVDLALPLENGVAITPVYEEMREAYEDWRLLSALRAAGKTEVLDALLKEVAESFDPPNMETAKPYKCDFQSLRDRALAAF